MSEGGIDVMGIVDSISSFSPLKRIVKGHGSWHLSRESLHTKLEKV